MRALLIGGGGPTGPHVLKGLIERGYETTLLNRGLHQPLGTSAAEHIRADPHFRESIEPALAGRRFDLVIASYGRLRLLAETLAGKCDRFISVGGIPAHLGVLNPDKMHPFGLRVLASEDDGLATHATANDPPSVRFAHRTWQTERRVMELHAAGAFVATHFRYPRIYGPRQPAPAEWSIVKRILDERRWMILPDGGLQIDARCAAENAAHCLLLGVDHPRKASGQIYNCIDDQHYTWRQWVEIIADMLGADLAVLSMPARLAAPARALTPMATDVSHTLIDGGKIRRELGYRDIVAPLEALQALVHWLVANPLAVADFERDPFDYAAEDKLIESWERHVAAIEREAPFPMPEPKHGYDHPVKPAV
jgi:nucleoside-diphosphate-sugar epimerase